LINSCFDLTHDLAMLLTGLDRSGGVVGLAWIDSLCDSNNCGVVENNAQFTWQFAAETLTHEMGHSWGMQHDG
jgi:predicted Zn-dependent protease